jgi:hypothetical protein
MLGFPRRAAIIPVFVVVGQVLAQTPSPASEGPAPPTRRCPPEMVLVRKFCVDRWEASMVDKATGERLSPYYPPQPRLLREVFQAWDVDRTNFGSEGARAMPVPEISEWQRTHDFDPKAVSVRGAVPQAYVS